MTPRSTRTPTIAQNVQVMLKDLCSRFGLEKGTAPGAMALQAAFYKHLRECLGRHWEIATVATPGYNVGRVARIWKPRPRMLAYNMDLTYVSKCHSYEHMHMDLKETLDAFLPVYAEWQASGVVIP